MPSCLGTGLEIKENMEMQLTEMQTELLTKILFTRGWTTFSRDVLLATICPTLNFPFKCNCFTFTHILNFNYLSLKSILVLDVT